jgi:hypothetical protein
MCNFKSGIVLKDAREKGGFKLLLSPWTESHSDLIAIHKLNDGKMLHFARIEFSPPDMSFAHKPETYKLRIDEERTPTWLDEEMKEKVTAKMTDYIKSIIVTGDINILIGGQFIVAPKAKVQCVKTCVISAVLGDATISDVRDSATISGVRGSATISDVGDSATISGVRDSATISGVRDSATISDVGGSATISDVRDSATISGVRDSATISGVRGSATISDVRDSATISDVGGSATISGVRDSATISGVWGSAKIENDQRTKKD